MSDLTDDQSPRCAPDPGWPARAREQDAARPFDGSSGHTRDSEATLYTLRSGFPIVARVTDHGASLVELEVPDRDGRLADVVLGFDTVDGYRSPRNPYLGATVDRTSPVNLTNHSYFNLGGHASGDILDHEPRVAPWCWQRTNRACSATRATGSRTSRASAVRATAAMAACVWSLSTRPTR